MTLGSKLQEVIRNMPDEVLCDDERRENYLRMFVPGYRKNQPRPEHLKDDWGMELADEITLDDLTTKKGITYEQSNSVRETGKGPRSKTIRKRRGGSPYVVGYKSTCQGR